ncbi:MAG: zinc-dependent peptidase [Egibacteraceae bacterium]
MITWSARRQPELLPDIEKAAARRVPHVELLEEEGRQRYSELVRALAKKLGWEAANGFALTAEMIGTVAGHAALMGLNLDSKAFAGVRTVVLHPTTMVLTEPRPGPFLHTVTEGPMPVLGHTTATGPVFIAWDVAREQARHPEGGQNVILHEFAHRLDIMDGTFDGTPPLHDRQRRQRWIDVFQAELDALRAGAGSRLLDDYAATNPSEFFAVATEAFFGRAAALRADRPELYDVLADYYRQDPAARSR